MANERHSLFLAYAARSAPPLPIFLIYTLPGGASMNRTATALPFASAVCQPVSLFTHFISGRLLVPPPPIATGHSQPGRFESPHSRLGLHHPSSATHYSVRHYFVSGLWRPFSGLQTAGIGSHIKSPPTNYIVVNIPSKDSLSSKAMSCDPVDPPSFLPKGNRRISVPNRPREGDRHFHPPPAAPITQACVP